MNSDGFQVAPHGIIGLAAIAIILLLLFHAIGLRVVGAVNVG